MSYVEYTFEEIAHKVGVRASLYTERATGHKDAFKWVESRTIEAMRECVDQGSRTRWKDCRKVVDITPITADYDLPFNYVPKEGMYLYNLESNVIHVELVSDLDNEGAKIPFKDIKVEEGYMVAPSQHIRVKYYYFHPNMKLSGALKKWVESVAYLLILENKKRSENLKISARREAEINEGKAFEEAFLEMNDEE